MGWKTWWIVNIHYTYFKINGTQKFRQDFKKRNNTIFTLVNTQFLDNIWPNPVF